MGTTPWHIFYLLNSLLDFDEISHERPLLNLSQQCEFGYISQNFCFISRPECGFLFI